MKFSIILALSLCIVVASAASRKHEIGKMLNYRRKIPPSLVVEFGNKPFVSLQVFTTF
jgi:hypothetical protein